MSITRILPRSEKPVYQALSKAKQYSGSVPPAEQPFTPATIIKLGDTLTFLKSTILTTVGAKYAMSKSTVLGLAAKIKARNFVNAFYQSFNNGIALLGCYDKESRVFYSIDINDAAVPKLVSKDNIMYWGDKILMGEPARIAAGGTAMIFPSLAEIDEVMSDFITKNNDSTTKKETYSDAQAIVTKAMPGAIQVVVKCWDEVETFYNHLPIEARRMKCRAAGVVYESTQKVIINVTVINKATGELIANAINTLLESGMEKTTDAAGSETFETTIAFGITLETEMENFITNTFALEFMKDINEYNVVIEMEHE
jgi:hypothetical protein